ncbi:hypothetical protein ACVB8X_41190 [Streptomyces sp. NRAIS4]
MADVAADAVDDQKVRQRHGVVMERYMLVGEDVGHVDEDLDTL